MAGLKNPQLEGGSFLWAGGSTGVLLSHGFRATTAEVRLLGKRLNQAGYTVCGPLLPGHGTEVAHLNGCRWEDWFEAILRAYKDLSQQCERVFVGGESMGSLLTLLLASQRPEIAGVLSYAPALRVSGMWKAAWLSHFIPVLERRETKDDMDWQGYNDMPLRGAAQLYRLMGVVRTALPQVRQPIIIFQGRLDQTIDIHSADEVFRSIGSQDKSLHWMNCSRHCILLDQELNTVSQKTLDFLARVSCDEEPGEQASIKV